MAVGCQPLTQTECVERCLTSDKCEMRIVKEDGEQKHIIFEEVGALMCGDVGEGNVDAQGEKKVGKSERKHASRNAAKKAARAGHYKTVD